MNEIVNRSRRGFLKTGALAGGGLLLGVYLPRLGSAAQENAKTYMPNAFVRIGTDDAVTVIVNHSEMGQGSETGLAQLVAEELECDWAKVRVEYPTPGENVARKRIWGDYTSTGSRSIRESHEYVRKGGAAARAMLIQAAANEWKVPASECTAANSVITHRASNRTTTFGKVADAAAKVEPPNAADIKLKDPKDWKIAGKPLKRLDTHDKLIGKSTYSIDVKQPGMLSAAIKASPVHGGKLKNFDAAKIESMKGVRKVVRVGDNAVAVIGDTWYQAKTALDALPIEWDAGENAKVSSATIDELLKAGLDADTRSSATRPATPRRPSRARRKRSRRCTPTATRRMPAWSRSTPPCCTRPTSARCGRARRTPKPHWRRRRKRPACRSPSATCTSSSWAADSDGAAAPTT